MNIVDDKYVVRIVFNETGVVRFKIMVFDLVGNYVVSSEYSLKITEKKSIYLYAIAVLVSIAIIILAVFSVKVWKKRRS